MTKNVEKKPRISRAQRIIQGIINKTTTKYDFEYHGTLLIELFEKGHDICTFCVAAEICRATFDNWVNYHPEFASALEHARQAARAYFSAEGLRGMQDPLNFNATAWSMQMRNRFEMTDKRKITVKRLKEAASFAEQYNCVKEEVSDGNLTADEAVSLTNMVSTGASIFEKTEVAENVKYLMSKDGKK